MYDCSTIVRILAQIFEYLESRKQWDGNKIDGTLTPNKHPSAKFVREFQKKSKIQLFLSFAITKSPNASTSHR